MVNELTLSKIIKLNTDVKDIPDNVFFSSKQCKTVTNHKCIFREAKDPDSLMKQIDELKSQGKQAERQYKESLESVKDKEKSYRKATIALGVLCVVVVVVLLFIMIVCRTARFTRNAPHDKSKYTYIRRRGSDLVALAVRRDSNASDVSERYNVNHHVAS